MRWRAGWRRSGSSGSAGSTGWRRTSKTSRKERNMADDLKTSTIANLDESLDGRVIRPGDPGYAEARQVFYGGHDLRPAIIVRASSDDDVARTVGLARDSGLELAVRSGGHSGA